MQDASDPRAGHGLVVASRRLPLPTKGDLLAALTTGIANVPDGMASGVLAGVNPVLGIYTLIVGTPLAALGVSSQLMMFNTTSAMTLVAVDGLAARTGPERAATLLVIALVAGLVQIAAGLLGLGRLTRFVSNAVMTGFLTGIAIRIVFNQLWDLTGYHDNLGGPVLSRTYRLLTHLPQIDPTTTAVGLGTLLLMALLGRGRLADFNLLIGLAAATVAAKLLPPGALTLVSSLGEVPRSLPPFGLPRLDLIPALLPAGLAVAAVGLLQAAGVAQAYPNPDGSPTNDSRDFVGQGIANAVGSCFSAMAGGGSVSGTALLVSAGAQTRWASILQAVVVVVVVLLFGGLLGLVPMTALAALLIYAALLSLKPKAISIIRRTSAASTAAMAATFLGTLTLPLQQAILLGVVLATMLYVYGAANDVRVTALVADGDRFLLSEAPAELASRSVTVLNVDGSLFYAGARTLGERLPPVGNAEQPVVVLGLRGITDIGSTFLKVLTGYAAKLEQAGGRLILSGVEPRAMERLERTGTAVQLGRENLFPADEAVGTPLAAAVAAGQAWIDAPPEDPTPPTGVPSGSPQLEAAVTPISEPVALPVAAVETSPALYDLVPHAVVGLVLALVAVAMPPSQAGRWLPLAGVVLLLAAVAWALRAGDAEAASRLGLGIVLGVSSGVSLLAGAILVASRWSAVFGETEAVAILWLAALLLGAIALLGIRLVGAGQAARLAVAGVGVLVAGLGLVGLAGSAWPPASVWVPIVGGVGLVAAAVPLVRREAVPEA